MADSRKTLPYEPGYIPDVPEDVFAEIGCRLVLLQNLENFIGFAAKVVFAKDEIEARKNILNADPKMLGQLLGALRKNTQIEEDFDECLKRTLKARNVFVHEFSIKFDLHSKDGLREGIRFLSETMDDLEEVSNVMKALVVSFGRTKGATDAELEAYWREHGDLNRLEKRYVPRLSKIFSQKAKS